VSVKFSFTPREVRLGMLSFSLRERGYQLLIGFGVAVLVVGILAGSGGAVAAGIVCVVAIALILVIQVMLTWSRTPSFRAPLGYRFAEDGIDVETFEARAHTQWSAYKRFVSTRRFYILVSTSRSVIIIPRRAFASAGEERVFLELVARSLTKPGLARPASD
jgi:hypothetical protein